MHDKKSWHETFMHEYFISMHDKLSCMNISFPCMIIWNFNILRHENDIFIQENETLLQRFPVIIFLSQKCSWVIWLCTIPCTELSSMVDYSPFTKYTFLERYSLGKVLTKVSSQRGMRCQGLNDWQTTQRARYSYWFKRRLSFHSCEPMTI